MTDPGPDAGGGGQAVLRVVGVSKSFLGALALDDVTLDVERGEILALLGGNGSGKSTLIKVLAGVHHADAGEIGVGRAGQLHAASSWSASTAKQANLHFVHQHLGLFPDLSVAENMALGASGFRGRWGGIDWPATRRRAAEVLRRFEIDTEPTARLDDLRPAEATMIAIARALQDQEDDDDAVLFLDEPTASLPAAEVSVLHAALRRYAAAGQTIVYVTHRLDEVLELADRVAVLRDGRYVATEHVSGLDERRLIELITGSAPATLDARPAAADRGQVVVRMRGVAGGPLRGVDLDLKGGEILGIAGLLGSGRTEVLRTLFGTFPAAGKIELDGEAVSFARPAEAIARGIAYVPEDRPSQGIFAEMSVRENLSAAVIRSYWNGWTIKGRSERRDAGAMVRRYGVKAGGIDAPMATLSGGNQQKVVVARWLRRNPRVLLLDEPTQGVDVGARAELYALIREAVADGTSVIVVSSDFEELAAVCDRVAILRAGRIDGECHAPHITGHRLTELTYAGQGATTS